MSAAGSKSPKWIHHDDPEDVSNPNLIKRSDILDIDRRVLANLAHAELCSDLRQREIFMTIAIIGHGPAAVALAGAVADLAKRSLKSNFCHIDKGIMEIIGKLRAAN